MIIHALLVGLDQHLGDRIRHTLSRVNVEVEVTHDGASGLAAALSAPPNVIILDSEISDFDSEELYWQLKCSPETRHVPLIVLTDQAENSMGSIDDQALTFGDFHLPKNLFVPFALVELLRFMDFIEVEPGETLPLLEREKGI